MLLAMSNRFDRPFRFQRETPTIRSTIYDLRSATKRFPLGLRLKLPDSSAVDSIGSRPFTMERFASRIYIVLHIYTMAD